jgi:hypothetical protein
MTSLGHLVAREKGFEAFDVIDQSIGIFADQDRATAAIYKADGVVNQEAEHSVERRRQRQSFIPLDNAGTLAQLDQVLRVMRAASRQAPRAISRLTALASTSSTPLPRTILNDKRSSSSASAASDRRAGTHLCALTAA